MSRNNPLSMQDYHKIVGWIFILIFIGHGLRIFKGWDVIIGAWSAPMWLSYVAVLLSAYLAYQAFQLEK